MYRGILCRLMSVGLAVLVFLGLTVITLDGACVPISTNMPNVTVDSQENDTETRNVTVNSTVDDLFSKLLSSIATQKTPPSSTYVTSPATSSRPSTQSPVGRWTEMPIETIQSHSEDVQSRATCPWTYTYNVDPSRVPRTLVEAQCTQASASNVAGQCEHVYYYVPVRRKVAGTWSNRWIWLRVGCTLADPISAPPITFD